MFAVDAGQATIIVAIVAAASTIVVGTITAAAALWQFLIKRSDAKNDAAALYTTEGYAISQRSLLDALAQAKVDREQDRAEIVALRAEVEQMRGELRVTLRHAAECDEARLLQDNEIRMLRDRLDGMAS